MVKSKQALVNSAPENKTQKQSVEEKLSILLRVDNCSISHLYDNQYMIHFNYPGPALDSLKNYAKKLELAGIHAHVSSSSFMSPQLILDSNLDTVLSATTDENQAPNQNASPSIANVILHKIMRLKV